MFGMNASRGFSRKIRQIPARLRQRGFSLIELSVATAIYSLGLGSLSLMMLLAVQGTTEAGLESSATLQVSSLAEMILMNSDAVGHYVLPEPDGLSACGSGQSCTPAQMAAWQLQMWRERLAADLPGGQGLVCRDRTPDDGDIHDTACDGEGGRVIKVFWRSADTTPDPDARPARQVLLLP
jgi:type IV pilus assembly protein PilV